MKKITLAIVLLTAIALSACQQQPPKKEEEKTVAIAKNAVVEAMMNRRSIRAYKPEQIKPEQLDTIINCAVNAPSAMNRQTWEVRVIQKPELLKAISDGHNSTQKPFPEGGYSFFYNAPTLVMVAGNKNERFSDVDCALLGQNILLAAESMDIGTCFIATGISFLNSPEGQAITQQLNLPADYQPLYFIAMGYKNERPEAKPRDEAKVQVIK